jgi:nucleoside-diphosphate-sugar epimerase
VNAPSSSPFSSPRRRVLILGAGYIGGALARSALAQGWEVLALTRNPARAAELTALGALPLLADLASTDWWQHPALAAPIDRVAVTVASGGGGLPGYQHSYIGGLRSAVDWARTRRDLGPLVYTSSTSVYPQGEGARITEASPAGAAAETTHALLEAERLAALWPGRGHAILRLAGIYGPGRTFLLEQVRRGEAAGHPENHLNLIHRDDAVAGLEAAWAWLENSPPPPPAPEAAVFNLADLDPRPKGEVVAWLAERLGCAAPRFTGQPAGSRRSVTPDRVIDSSRARRELGWAPRYPTYREGYAHVLAAALADRADGA